MKEKNEGTMMQYVTKALGEAGMEIKDITSGVSLAMAAKDEKELGFVNKAVTLTSKALGFAVREMEGTIEDEKKLTHAKLSEMTEDAIIDPSRLGLKFPPEDVDICYPPIFQSGGEYDLRYSAESANAQSCTTPRRPRWCTCPSALDTRSIAPTSVVRTWLIPHPRKKRRIALS